MDLYLVRHGQAEPGDNDACRPLSKKGLHQADVMAKWVKNLGVGVTRIEHSPLLRARETAEALAVQLNVDLFENPRLTPNADAHAMRTRILTEDRSLMLVGHNPFMEILAGLLTTELEATPLMFRTGSIARFTSTTSGLGWRFTCVWLLSPEMRP